MTQYQVVWLLAAVSCCCVTAEDAVWWVGEDITSKLAADIRYHQLPVNCCKLDAIRYRPFE